MLQEKRNAGVDLLRIILAWMVIWLHLTGLNVEGRLLHNINFLSVGGVTCYAITALCMVNINTFVISSGYFGIQREARYHKVVHYWLQGVFYNMIVTFLYVCETKTFAAYLADPLTTGVYMISVVGSDIWWFLSAFVVLIFCKPLLNMGINHMSPIALKKLIRIILLAVIVYPDVVQGVNYVFGKSFPYYSVAGSGFSWIWLVCLYIIGASLAKLPGKMFTKEKGLFLYFASMLLCIGVSYGLSIWLKEERLITYYMRYTSLFMTLGAVWLFLFFLHLDIKSEIIRKMLFLSKYTFGVYLFHEHPVARDWLEAHVYAKLPYMGGLKLLLVICGNLAGIYIVGVLIEMIREKIFSILHIEKKIGQLSERVGLMLQKREGIDRGE